MLNTVHGRLHQSVKDGFDFTLSVGRILIATYFLAIATSLWIKADARLIFDGVLSVESAQIITVLSLALTAGLLLANRFVRPSLVLLGMYTLWTGIGQIDLATGPGALSNSWRDVTVLATLLLISIAHPGSSSWKTQAVQGPDKAPVPVRA